MSDDKRYSRWLSSRSPDRKSANRQLLLLVLDTTIAVVVLAVVVYLAGVVIIKWSAG